MNEKIFNQNNASDFQNPIKLLIKKNLLVIFIYVITFI